VPGRAVFPGLGEAIHRLARSSTKFVTFASLSVIYALRMSLVICGGHAHSTARTIYGQSQCKLELQVTRRDVAVLGGCSLRMT
jgi:hypothetical protein